MKGLRVGAAMCGSFCTFSQIMPQIRRLAEMGCEVYPIMSPAAYETDTRFGKAAEWRSELEAATGRVVWHTLPDVEPIGPRKLLEVMLVAPCTGNTLAKLAAGISDTSVTMACKSHLRNGRPVVLAISTNDALSASARNIGQLMNRRDIYFVPFGQDDPFEKPCSCSANFALLYESVMAAREGRQLQPSLSAAAAL
ncbi:MAG: dipicolinate synthase subunit B [Oscillospiraceae bacterium]|nr:dipicolinate synthase subunit B [Oscillospiraceae bacterium]